MLIDFQDVKRTLKPLVDAWDHAILVAGTDTELLHIVEQTGWKHTVLPCDTTAENLSAHVAEHLCTEAGDRLRARNVETVRVRLAETETCYAEVERRVPATTTAEPNRSTAMTE